MHMLVSAVSGWGKGWLAHALTEKNIKGDTYDRVVVLDTSDEFRGLVSKETGPGLAAHWFAGPRERDHFDADTWGDMIDRNEALVVGRHVSKDDWQQVARDVILACRQSDHDVLIVIDEAHGVAPQSEGYPTEIKELATDGRSEGGSATSSIWVTQRLAQIDKNVTGNCTAFMLGGYRDTNTLNSIKDMLEYPKELHNTGGQPVTGLSESLHAEDEGAVSVRKWVEELPNGETQTVNSEWIYSDDSGDVNRIQSSDYGPECEHVGAEGKRIEVQP
ncbi:ATP-binding protein [Halorubrum sp. DTA46]|uniref:ATP-binding protein n=1 Tax=Halorubrum sp. DTA46 TaxID=3402162 RepID=UPI003AAC9B20